MDFSLQKSREIIFQVLFSFSMNEEVGEDLIQFLMRELEVSKKNVTAAYQKAQDIWLQHTLLDNWITEKSRNYSFSRIKSVEKSVLRLALYELLIEKELNPKIIISEAHRLARKFSTVEGASFVNALLEEAIRDSAFCTSEGKAPL